MIPMVEKTAPPKKTSGAPPKAATKPSPTAAPRPAAPAPKQAKPLTAETRIKLEQISAGLDILQEDTSVPRNIRRGADEAKKLLWDETLALDVRKASAMGILDELANDPNIPLHGRTLIWSIMSQLEPLA